MARKDFISRVHNRTQRDYLQRVVGADKAQCATVAKKFGKEYWDGDRKFGYGGHHYDGRWREFAETLVQTYGIRPGSSLLDVGCGKGFLLYELSLLVPDLKIAGLDISSYAVENSKPEVRSCLVQGSAVKLPWPDKSFDVVLAINVLHNLQLPQLVEALAELERVARKDKFLVVDAYRTEQEKVNLLYWQLTCECFFSPPEWEWIFRQSGYSGDYDFVCFE